MQLPTNPGEDNKVTPINRLNADDGQSDDKLKSVISPSVEGSGHRTEAQLPTQNYSPNCSNAHEGTKWRRKESISLPSCRKFWVIDGRSYLVFIRFDLLPYRMDGGRYVDQWTSILQHLSGVGSEQWNWKRCGSANGVELAYNEWYNRWILSLRGELFWTPQ